VGVSASFLRPVKAPTRPSPHC